jgi:membrane peptidoglycan carboxypeptidase
LGLSAVILVTGLYEFVVNEYEDDLGRTYPELAQDSYVYDKQGKKIGEIPAAESRETVGRPGFGEHLPQAVVAAIRALAGREGSFNLPLDARRQPGSSFKLIVLAAALREKISPESTYVFKELSFTCQERDYVVANYESVERGEISVAEAMAESDNTAFVQLAADVGLQNVVETAETLGITTPVEPYPSTAIGGLGVDVSPLDMASAYSTFPAAASTASRTRSSASSG